MNERERETRQVRHSNIEISTLQYVLQRQTSAPIGAWKSNFPAFSGNNDRPTDGQTNRPANHPTDGHEGS